MRSYETKREIKPPDDRRYKTVGFRQSLIDVEYLRSYPVTIVKSSSFVQELREAGEI